ncbi:MAG: DUF2779 domain-containing protein [Patescibacteria group bacterium]
MSRTTLSKSEYLLFLKHPAWLWLKKHDKEKLPPVDDNQQALFDTGYLIEEYAQKLFPGGTSLGFSDFSEYQTLTHRTQEALKSGATTLFQGKFDSEQLACICDILVFTGPKTVELYEVKSSTKVKPEHEHDLAFQMTVLENLGYTVDKIAVVHINNGYVRNGEIDCEQLFTVSDVTEAVRAKRTPTNHNITEALKVIESSTIPDISPRHARNGTIYEWLPIFKALASFASGSIYDICTPTPNLFAELEDLGITNLVDIPDAITLSDKQMLHVQSTRNGQRTVDGTKIEEFLNTMQFPLYFLDYETLSSAIPAFDGLRPYQQIPCQYSLHVLETPGGDLKHFEYLHRTNTNPAQELAKSLKENIGSTGTVLVWYEKFEKGCNRDLAKLAPEYKEFFTQLNDRIVDLMWPFSNGWYVDPGFKGSSSIKKILPILVPELKHSDLDISEGATAQRLWMQAVLDGKEDIDKETLFHNLCEYCKLDTLAMVKIFEAISKPLGETPTKLQTAHI